MLAHRDEADDLGLLHDAVRGLGEARLVGLFLQGLDLLLLGLQGLGLALHPVGADAHEGDDAHYGHYQRDAAANSDLSTRSQSEASSLFRGGRVYSTSKPDSSTGVIGTTTDDGMSVGQAGRSGMSWARSSAAPAKGPTPRWTRRKLLGA